MVKPNSVREFVSFLVFKPYFKQERNDLVSLSLETSPSVAIPPILPKPISECSFSGLSVSIQ